MSTRPPTIVFVNHYIYDPSAVVKALGIAVKCLEQKQAALRQANSGQANNGRKPGKVRTNGAMCTR